MREAILYSIFWISISLIFNGFIWYFLGAEKAGLFLTGYIVEKALSVDNLFVFIIIFNYFNVDPKYQHRVLYYGILGALITRGIFIFAGITIIEMFHPILYAFGGFLIYTAVKIIMMGDEKKEYKENVIVRYIKGILPVCDRDERFFVNHNKVFYITPLFIVLIAIETTDVMFAFDSIPAVLSITTDRFIVYTSNIFAILGLRALFFVINDLMPMFVYLKYGLSVVLGFIGMKLLIADYYTIPIFLSLSIVAGVLVLSVIGSIIVRKYDKKISL